MRRSAGFVAYEASPVRSVCSHVLLRHFATLYFIFVTDEMESALGILDLIQVGLLFIPFTGS